MKSRVLQVYLKWFTVAKFILKMLAPLKLAWYIYRHDYFGKGNGISTLKVLCQYLKLEKSYFSDKLVKYRNVDESLVLFESLINNYKVTNSSYKLGQILTVLKEDFLERDKND